MRVSRDDTLSVGDVHGVAVTAARSCRYNDPVGGCNDRRASRRPEVGARMQPSVTRNGVCTPAEPAGDATARRSHQTYGAGRRRREAGGVGRPLGLAVAKRVEQRGDLLRWRRRQARGRPRGDGGKDRTQRRARRGNADLHRHVEQLVPATLHESCAVGACERGSRTFIPGVAASEGRGSHRRKGSRVGGRARAGGRDRKIDDHGEEQQSEREQSEQHEQDQQPDGPGVSSPPTWPPRHDGSARPPRDHGSARRSRPGSARTWRPGTGPRMEASQARKSTPVTAVPLASWPAPATTGSRRTSRRHGYADAPAR